MEPLKKTLMKIKGQVLVTKNCLCSSEVFVYYTVWETLLWSVPLEETLHKITGAQWLFKHYQIAFSNVANNIFMHWDFHFLTFKKFNWFYVTPMCLNILSGPNAVMGHMKISSHVTDLEPHQSCQAVKNIIIQKTKQLWDLWMQPENAVISVNPRVTWHLSQLDFNTSHALSIKSASFL